VRLCAPFLPDDLVALEQLYERATAIVPMEEIYDSLRWDLADEPMKWGFIGVRHDCDNVILPAVQMARWEADRGYRSTYYILHSAPYWNDKPLLRQSLEAIEECGHELGIHNDALTVALQTGRDPAEILQEAIDELRGYGHTIRSTVAHGNSLCHIAKYVNDEMFLGCARPTYGDPDRTLEHRGRTVRIRQRSLLEFGLDFDANWLSRGDYLSDSGGRWSRDFDQVASEWPARGQLHMLVHPDWWAEAFERVAA
jgi:hypothetical protein